MDTGGFSRDVKPENGGRFGFDLRFALSSAWVTGLAAAAFDIGARAPSTKILFDISVGVVIGMLIGIRWRREP